ncbi:type IV toxin-antitoxin system AbiEi family antitoxin domain-containing protein [Sphingobacterium sp. MYb388]|uniref:type IV toxin-antitoxin system AbiEi family antitoxin domain-containing protein n=1 Tax=Sphingobacterium sp. MYb388 TaxID=2745437 RepID=UPI00309A55D0
MANISRVKRVKSLIINTFTNTGVKAYSRKEVLEIYENFKSRWGLPFSTNPIKFLQQIEKENILSKISVEISQSNLYKDIYYLPDASDEEIALSISNKAFLSHYSALYYHQLTEQIPKEIIVTIEDYQRMSPVINTLSQEGIHSAFSKPQRESNSIFNIRDSRIRIHKGKYTNETGVKKIGIKVTNIERTLIDIIVRLSYSGGLSEVIKAYQKAGEAKLISINRLLNYLHKLDYTYPYHQCIGLIMERTGVFNESQLSKIESIGIKYDFYLAYNIENKEYDNRWKVFYPKNLFV